MLKSEKLRALILSLLILGFFLAAWQIGTMPFTSTQVVDAEYAKLVGSAASSGQKSAFPTPMDVGRKLVEQLSDPFYDKGPNDKGLNRKHIIEGTKASLRRLQLDYVDVLVC